MAVGLHAPVARCLQPVAGCELGWAQAGIRKAGRKDLLLIRLADRAAAAGVFTRNRFCAAPVQVCRAHLGAGVPIRALLINTGCANAGTGAAGVADALRTCEAAARLIGCEPAQVLPFSTGVIMEPLPVQAIVDALPQAVARLDPAAWLEAAETIMTTDTVPKAVSRSCDLGGAIERAIGEVAHELALAIVRDGEGASKFIRITVENARSRHEASTVAYAVAHSPLVKTAMFASDPNLGRILSAVGASGIEDLDPSAVQLYLNDVWVARDGARHPDYREQDGQHAMRGAEILVRIVLGRGSAAASVWTCDLSHQYVSINADYRS